MQNPLSIHRLLNGSHMHLFIIKMQYFFPFLYEDADTTTTQLPLISKLCWEIVLSATKVTLSTG